MSMKGLQILADTWQEALKKSDDLHECVEEHKILLDKAGYNKVSESETKLIINSFMDTIDEHISDLQREMEGLRNAVKVLMYD